MRRINAKYCLGLAALCFAVSFTGCISIPTSPTPRYYALTPMNENKAVVADSMSARLNAMIIGIGPVKIPEYLNRPQIVTMNNEKMLQFAQFDRWGESLDIGLARLIREDIALILPSAKLTLYPWNPLMAVKYQVIVEIIQLNSQLDQNMFFDVQWTVLDLQNLKTVMIKKSTFRTAIVGHNYAGLVRTLSTACASLSNEIAKSLTKLN